jgi:lysophospholipase L1-like esterase
VVLGDSFSSETPGVDGAPWPEILGQELGWDVITDAPRGSGYLVPGSGMTVPDRVQQTLDLAPDVVVVAAGVSDLSRPVDDVAAAAEEVVVRLRDGLPEGEVVLLSPFSDGPAGELTTALTVRLEAVAAEQGVAYVDVTDLLPRDQGLLAPDGVHPSEAGHRHVAEAVAVELTDLGVGGEPAGG